MLAPEVVVSKSEWQEWKRSRVTKALVAHILNERQIALDAWSEGKSGELGSVTKGRTQAYKEVIDYIIENFMVADDKEDKGD